MASGVIKGRFNEVIENAFTMTRNTEYILSIVTNGMMIVVYEAGANKFIYLLRGNNIIPIVESGSGFEITALSGTQYQYKIKETTSSQRLCSIWTPAYNRLTITAVT